MKPQSLPDVILDALSAWSWLGDPLRASISRDDRAALAIEKQAFVHTLLDICGRQPCVCAQKMHFTVQTAASEEGFTARLIPHWGEPLANDYCACHSLVSSHLAQWDAYGWEPFFLRIYLEDIKSLATRAGMNRVLGRRYGAYRDRALLQSQTPRVIEHCALARL